jgi:hypothetical protein
MPAYVIVEVEIQNHGEYEEYKKLTPAAIAAFDGKFIVRGGKTIRLKEIGIRNGSLCWNFPLPRGLTNGGILNCIPGKSHQTESRKNKNAYYRRHLNGK